MLVSVGYAGLPGASVSAQASLDATSGGPIGYGTGCLSPNDDGSSDAIDLTPAFPSGLRFFDHTHHSIYINTNGNVSFSAPLWAYTPDPFPIADQPMIAPYWGDVDIGDSGGARCERNMGNEGCRNPPDQGVWWHLEPGRLVATWDRVGFYECHDDKRMSFQLILAAAASACGSAGDFDVEFRYNRCEWTTGDASDGSGGFGGVPAQAGFDAGNLRDFVEIMGSRTGTIHTTLCTMSNVGMPGIWRFQIRSGAIICPDAGDACDTGMPGVCALGKTQCIGMGTACVAQVASSPERCDALDNDCDGMVDDGDICGRDQVCANGYCVDRCFEGGCNPGETCNAANYCVEASCDAVECGAGERCRGGACVDACDGVECPIGQRCEGGRCAEVCAGVECDECAVCTSGRCVLKCPNNPCPEGTSCQPDGSCAETACTTVLCGRGQVCRAGACVDACAGATCPTGQVCELGDCVAPSTVAVDAGLVSNIVDAATAADAGGDPMQDAGGGRGVTPRAPSGCACGVIGARSRPMSFEIGLGALALLVGSARRTRRARA